MTFLKTTSSLSIALACFVGLGFGIACGAGDELEDDAQGIDDDNMLTDQDRQACEDYCQDAKSCDDDLDVSDCMSSCVDGLQSCEEAELDEATSDLTSCTDNDECLDVVDCGFEVSSQCYFGL